MTILALKKKTGSIVKDKIEDFIKKVYKESSQREQPNKQEKINHIIFHLVLMILEMVIMNQLRVLYIHLMGKLDVLQVKKR